MSSRSERLFVAGFWMIATSLVLLVVYLGLRGRASSFVTTPLPEPVIASVVQRPVPAVENVVAPSYHVASAVLAVPRRSLLHTIIPSRPRQEIINYEVGQGDSVFGIAKKYNIKPETVLWANYDLLEDSPDSLSPGMVLNIPPVDGVYYQVKDGDTLNGVAVAFKASLEDILTFPGNDIDLTNPAVEPGKWVMVPGGQREFRSWIVPQIARGKAGVSQSVYGAGACQGSYEGVYGTGGFIWPSANHYLSGNDFWSGHLGIDIAAGLGDAVFASDSGVIVFAGGATGGYGYMVMIDHGNGYQTLYAHLSSVSSSCGQSVYQGQYIAATGSTGNSTGTHLHFEVRLWGQFVNPWHVLP